MADSKNAVGFTLNLLTNIVDFGGFASIIMLTLRGGIRICIGDFAESVSQAIVVGIMLVGRLGVLLYLLDCTSRAKPGEVHTARF